MPRIWGKQDKCASIFDIYPRKIPWEVLRDFDAIHEIHPSAKAVPAYQRIGSFRKSIETFNGEALTTKEEMGAKDGDTGVQ